MLQDRNYIQRNGYQPPFQISYQYTLIIINLGEDSIIKKLLDSSEVQIIHLLRKKTLNPVVFPQVAEFHMKWKILVLVMFYFVT